MVEYTCQMCGLKARMSAIGWIAHRLETFDVHFPWKGTRFLNAANA